MKCPLIYNFDAALAATICQSYSLHRQILIHVTSECVGSSTVQEKALTRKISDF
jgi:hypothetical protein